MGIDFAALGTGMDIRQALDVLVRPGTQEAMDAAAVVLERLKELETRLNTARRTAWVAVPIAAELVRGGDVVVAKDGRLMPVVDTEHLNGGQVGLKLVERSDGDLDMPWRRMPGDREVPVLKRPTADALDILTRQLGAQVVKE